MPDLLTEIERLRAVERDQKAEIARLRGALEKYGMHEWDCSAGPNWGVIVPNDPLCTCGLRAAVLGEEAT